MKLTKEGIDKVRDIEGFPIAKDEDIIALSNPPYYTACPNPFIEDFIKKYGKPYDEATDDYHREPFAADVSEGKNDPIYNAHSYHTKVPHKAIMRYILHYTDPGDIVFDGFCGTGMTGVAAQMCENPDDVFKSKVEYELGKVNWGARKAILSDLSPAATFIAYNYNTPIDMEKFEREANFILDECQNECGWMYETRHLDEKGYPVMGLEGEIKGKINYTVWSDIFICPNCGEEIIFYNVAFDKKNKIVKENFQCQKCGADLIKTDCERAKKLIFDKLLNKTIVITKQVPVLINYTVGRKKFEKIPDKEDLNLIEKIDNIDIPNWYPTNAMMFKGEKWGDSWRAGYHYGITHTHHFYTKRNLYVLSLLRKKCNDTLLFWFTASLTNLGINCRYKFGKSGNVPLSGTLYISSMTVETNVIHAFEGKLPQILKGLKDIKVKQNALISLSSTTNTMIPNSSIDYIFTDPPFGDNLMYSELNFISESWLKVITNNLKESIINKSQRKDLFEYQELMIDCFKEYNRVLKPNRWLTVEFHNSRNAVWNSIQESLQRSGFIIADVRTLDKQQGSFKQVNNTTAVKQDLVISAYKPKESFKNEFLAHAGTEETAWDFARLHLEKLPVVVVKDGKIELAVERQAFLLFDRMVAYHIINGIPVPIDAFDFYKGLDERFLKRDDMYFLHDQINEYDNARIKTDVEPIQFTLMVNDEKTAIAWLYQQLVKPQTYGEIQPKFMQESRSIEKYEKLPELLILLEDNFLQDEDGKWYIPDVTKLSDVTKLREKRLLKEFDEYLNSTGKLKLFRTEAIRAGFAKLWKDKNYALIVKTAERLPESVIQEDDKLLMYYDISLSRI